MGRVPVVGTDIREDVAEVAVLERVPVAGKTLDVKSEGLAPNCHINV
jgi:hypothetical protein